MKIIVQQGRVNIHLAEYLPDACIIWREQPGGIRSRIARKQGTVSRPDSAGA